MLYLSCGSMRLFCLLTKQQWSLAVTDGSASCWASLQPSLAATQPSIPCDTSPLQASSFARQAASTHVLVVFFGRSCPTCHYAINAAYVIYMLVQQSLKHSSACSAITCGSRHHNSCCQAVPGFDALTSQCLLNPCLQGKQPHGHPGCKANLLCSPPKESFLFADDLAYLSSGMVLLLLAQQAEMNRRQRKIQLSCFVAC